MRSINILYTMRWIKKDLFNAKKKTYCKIKVVVLFLSLHLSILVSRKLLKYKQILHVTLTPRYMYIQNPGQTQGKGVCVKKIRGGRG